MVNSVSMPQCAMICGMAAVNPNVSGSQAVLQVWPNSFWK